MALDLAPVADRQLKQHHVIWEHVVSIFNLEPDIKPHSSTFITIHSKVNEVKITLSISIFNA